MKKSMIVIVLLAGAAIAAFTLFGESLTAATPAKPATAAPKSATAGAPVARTEAEMLLDQGIAALQGGNISKAREVFADVISRFPSTPSGARASLENARIYVQANDPVSARNILANSLSVLPDGAARQEVLTQMDRLNSELVFSRKAAPDSIEYVVRPGDSLEKIGKKFKISAPFIKRINYLSSDRLNIKDRLKVFQGPFSVVVDKPRFRLTVYLNGQFVKEYRVGLGKENSTPAGEYSVRNKMVDPTWDPPGPEFKASKAPDNPLGTRWIEFNKEYGIHGTIAPDSIGKMESRGCVRMLNSDVEELYDLVVIGSKVTLR